MIFMDGYSHHTNVFVTIVLLSSTFYRKTQSFQHFEWAGDIIASRYRHEHIVAVYYDRIQLLVLVHSSYNNMSFSLPPYDIFLL